MLKDSVCSLKGIGKKKADLLADIGIYYLHDILDYFPNSYEDRRYVTKISELEEGRKSLIKARILKVIKNNFTRGKRVVRFIVVDESKTELDCVFFNQPYLANVYKTNQQFYFYGLVSSNGNSLQIVHPEIIKVEDFKRSIVPYYLLPKGISQKEFQKYVLSVMDMLGKTKDNADSLYGDFIPITIAEKNGLCSSDFMYQNIHFPKDKNFLKAAKYRKIYEDLFVMQLGLDDFDNEKKNSPVIDIDTSEFIDDLDFELTAAQKKVVDEISSDLASGVQMNRLVQGDVGCGKTAVAQVAMYQSVKGGYQTVFMAPTELLAKQHYNNMSLVFERYGFKTVLLVSSMKAKEKREVLEAIKSGDADVIVGTHALIQERVEFNNLGLAIIDEQHRFGVKQREALSNKGCIPHILLMTATPIPRTLTVLLYAGLDISVIDELPSGRKKIDTVLVKNKTDRKRLLDNLIEEIESGGQVYIVVPLINQSDDLEGVNATDNIYNELCVLYKKVKIGAEQRSVEISVLHGGMPKLEKDIVMSRFVKGEVDILISTVVIEVGVDVPNASIMVIENAERFGLAQLHQLRGRVGRRTKQSYCYLVSQKNGDIARKRLDIMKTSTDGFYISEQDLLLRGPGEVFGTRQHGLPDMQIMMAIKYKDILDIVKNDIEYLKKDDSMYLNLKNNTKLGDKISKMFNEKTEITL